MPIFYLIISGLVLHVIFLFAIFDIYFKSPILKEIPAVINNIEPPGKRVVLVSVDGLRADALFMKNFSTSSFVAEHLQSVIHHRGTWGISRSRVPTESRPGHVALLAGFYEDPSAVTKGWKDNPVDFDSVFNRSRCSFSWGSPDIINIFYKGLHHRCAFAEHYQDEQNFAGDSMKYDNWVYNKVKEFMRQSILYNTDTRYSVIQEKGILFFLHLLGQDTSGHMDKPHSKKYRDNLQNVDYLLKKVENLFNDIYKDNKTTFIVTSDHGMTNWGSHGAGDSDETDTPIVAWGAGIRKPSFPIEQNNISQADVTPLLAILLGVSIPVNSVGILPYGFLNMSWRNIAEATELNARQMAAQFIKGMKDKEANIVAWLFKPFPKLSFKEIDDFLLSIAEAIKFHKYFDAIKQSKLLIEICLEGLNYYHNYYQRCLLITISLSYFGWIVYLILILLEDDKSIHKCPPYFKTFKTIFTLTTFITITLIAIQRLPWSYYFYLLLPQILWYKVLTKGLSLLPPLNVIKEKKRFIFLFVCIVPAVEILVLSFFMRWVLCMSLVFVNVWALFSAFRPIGDSYLAIKILWMMSGIILGTFTLIPTIGSQPNPYLTVASGLGLCLLMAVVAKVVPEHNRASRFRLLIEFISLALAIWNNYSVHSNFNENHNVSDTNKYLSWILLIVSCCLLQRNKSDILQTLLHLFLILSVPFVLLSITHEVFFLMTLFIHLSCWIFIESCMKKDNSTFTHFRIAYFFLTYIFISFFGLGNISSLNSFDPAWVRCFITAFWPLLMTSLILFKTLIPFLVVTCTVRIIIIVLNLKPKILFVIILIYCNIMALNFLFLIKNTGSWLDIGVSISHYVIQQVTILFLLFLFGLAKFLIFPSSKCSISDINKLEQFLENKLPLYYSFSAKKSHNF